MVRYFLMAVLMGVSAWSSAEPTELKVMVRASDSKFIGSGVGGMNVIVENAKTGALLDAGRISGETGDTEALMTRGQTRGRSPVTEGDASFTAQLDIDRPTRVRVSVTGPLDVAESSQSISTSLWVLPGKDQVHPGVILQMPGLIVDLKDKKVQGGDLFLTAKVTMMCGCPITKEGLWPASDYTSIAQVYQGDELLRQTPLAFTGNANEFIGVVEGLQPGEYELVLQAYQKSLGNTGVYERQLRID